MNRYDYCEDGRSRMTGLGTSLQNAVSPYGCAEQQAEANSIAAQQLPQSDAVFRPNHYARFAIEPITFIMANSLPYCVGNVIKYVMRYDAKNGREDLMKARRYIDMMIEDLERKANGTVADCVGKPL